MATQAKIHLSVDGSAQVISEFDRVESKVGKLGDAVDRAKSTLALFGVGLGVGEFARISDEYAKYTAQLKLATNGELEYANARSRVSSIAKESQSELAATGNLYARVTNGTRELGISQKKVGDIVEAVTLSLKVSNATQEESSSAILQLSQSFASGALRGEEFNAVNEAAPRIMKALADGLGVPIGALRDMAKEGKLTSQVLAETLPGALESLREEAAQVQTIGGAYTNLKNNVMEMIGAQSQQNGTAALLAGTINTLANNLNLVTAAATGFAATRIAVKIADMALSAKASVLASTELAAAKARETAASIATAQATVAETQSKLVQLTETRAGILSARADTIAKLGVASAAITQAQAQIQAATSAGALSTALSVAKQGEVNLTVAMQARALATTELAILGRQQASVMAQTTAATIAATAAQTGLATTVAGASAGTGLLARAVGFLGGPIGIITTLLGVGTAAWLAWGNKSKESTELASESLKESTAAILKSLDAQIAKHEKIISLREKGLGLEDAKKVAENKNRTQLELEGQGLADLLAGKGAYQSKSLSREDKLTERAAIMERIVELTKKINEEEAKGEKASGITRNEKLKDWFDKNGSAAQRMAAELAKLKKEFGEIPPEMEKVIRAKYADKSVNKEIAAENTAAHKLLMARLKVQKEMQDDVHKDLKAFETDQLARTKTLTKEIAGSIQLQDKNYQSMSNSMEVYAQTMADNNELAQYEISLLGRSSVERATLIEQKKIEIQLEKQIKEIRASNMADAQKNILIDKANAQARIDNDTAYLKATQQEYAKTVEKYDDIFSKSFADMLNNNEGTWGAFTQSLKTTFKTQFADELYKMFARPFVVKLVGSLLGITGAGTATAQGIGALTGDASSGGGVSSYLSMGKSIYEGFSSGFSGFGNSVANYVQTGLDKAGLSMTSGGNSAFATGAGTVASYGAGIAAGVYGGRAISAGYGSNSVVNVGTIAGAFLGGPIGAAIGGAIGGGLNRLFGMKAKEITSQTVSGSLGGNLSYGETTFQKGGIFRSDKYGSSSTSLQSKDADLFNGLNSAYDALKASTGSFATALGLNADVIVSRTDAINFSIGKTKEETQAAIESAFAKISDDMARTLIPSIAEMSKEGETASATLGRIATGFVTVNAIFADLQLSLFKVGDEGYKASSVFVDLVGGVEALKATSQSYFDNYFTEEERKAKTLQALTAEFEKQALPIQTTRKGYRALVEEISKTGTPEQLATLFKLNDAFASVYAAIDNTAALAKQKADADKLEADILSQRLSLQEEYNQLTMTSAQLLNAQSAAIYASNVTLYESIQAVKAKQSADAEALVMQTAIAQERAVLQAELDNLTLTEEEKLKRKRDSLYKTNQDIFDQIRAEEAKQAMIEQSKIDAQKLLDAEKEAFESQYNAAKAIQDVWKGAADSIADEMNRIRGVVSQSQATSFSAAQAKFAITTAQARANDVDAAKLLPSLSKTMLDLYESQATSALDLTLMQARTAQSLEDTLKYLGGGSPATSPTGFAPQNFGGQFIPNEAIVPSAYNPSNSGGNNDQLVQMLRKEIFELRNVVSNLLTATELGNDDIERMKDAFIKVTEGGRAMQAEIINTVKVTS